jgi:hypothetical protein
MFTSRTKRACITTQSKFFPFDEHDIKAHNEQVRDNASASENNHTTHDVTAFISVLTSLALQIVLTFQILALQALSCVLTLLTLLGAERQLLRHGDTCARALRGNYTTKYKHVLQALSYILTLLLCILTLLTLLTLLNLLTILTLLTH